MCQSTYFHEVNLRKIPLFWQYKVEVSRVLLPYAQRPGISAGWEFVACPARLANAQIKNKS